MLPWIRVGLRRRIKQGGVGAHESVKVAILSAEAVTTQKPRSERQRIHRQVVE